MNYFKFFLCLIGVSFFTSCSLTVDVDNQDELARISASAIGNNTDGTVSEGGYIDLEINIFDRDGVKSIRIEIPAINIDFSTDIKNRNTEQKITQSFNVNSIDATAPTLIYLTITDNDGNLYERTIDFSVR